MLETAPRTEEICHIRPEEEALVEYLTTPKPVDGQELFDCGVPDCQKRYAHEHVGITNEQQTGLVISENDIVGENNG